MNDKPKENDATAAFEKLLAMDGDKKYLLRLFVSGMTPSSLRAIKNIREICEQHLKDRCELEVIDIYQHPEMGRTEQVVAAPTLIKKLPMPLRKFIGDLSDREKILVGLDLVAKDEAGKKK
jgi:circadian clock protein KaiB